jgi:ubiquinone/menaquinone biosynthesis C-methylase UbiE
MFHHLKDADKATTLREVRRVLKPGATFHLMDFVKADSTSAGRAVARWLHSGPRLKDNSDARILSLMQEAGMSDPKRVAGRRLLIGDIAYYQASRL